jgi:amino acid permease
MSLLVYLVYLRFTCYICVGRIGVQFMSVCLFVLISIGYSYAISDTLGNVLLNFPTNDAIITLGRGCLGLTCLFNFPLLVLPCRVSVKKCLAATFGTKLQPSRSNSEESANGRPHHRVRRTPRNTAPLLGNGNHSSSSSSHHGVDDDVDEEGGMDAADDEPEAPIDARSMNHPSSLRRMIQTAIIIALSFLLSKFVPGVATIWSIMGSSVSMTIAYILPSLFYLKIRGHKALNPRKAGAFILLILSVIAAIVCTYLSIEQAFGTDIADALIH